jgi:Acetoacetate decarboxylase (ADC)
MAMPGPVSLPGVPESALDDATAAALPPASPPAPCAVRAEAVVWWHRAAPGAGGHVAPALRGARALPVTVGAFVSYASSPVGPYHEILACPVLPLDGPVPTAHVPFIAVDSPASAMGGRVNWALPKTLASFAWSRPADAPAAGGLAVEARSAGPVAWSVSARVRRRPRRLPVAVSFCARQAGADGAPWQTAVRLHGRVQAARVDVDCSGPTLPDWLRAGRHAGLVVPRAHVVVDAAR